MGPNKGLWGFMVVVVLLATTNKSAEAVENMHKAQCSRRALTKVGMLPSPCNKGFFFFLTRNLKGVGDKNNVFEILLLLG